MNNLDIIFYLFVYTILIFLCKNYEKFLLKYKLSAKST